MSNEINIDFGKSLGSIKLKTKNFNFIIPYFDIATWHDYIEQNFKSIDAIISYIYSIANYKGAWTVNTLYKVGEKVFIDDVDSQYYGRLFEVLVEHSTTDTTFDNFYNNNKSYYKLYLDANDSYKYAQESKNYSDLSKNYLDQTQSFRDEALSSKQLAQSYAENAETSATNAQSYATSAENYKNECKNEADFVRNYPIIKNNLEIVKELWVETEYPEIKSSYPYQALLTSIETKYIDYNYQNLISTIVTFSAEQVALGIFAPFCYCIINGDKPLEMIHVLIFAKEIPNSERIFVPAVTLYYKEKENE